MRNSVLPRDVQRPADFPLAARFRRPRTLSFDMGLGSSNGSRPGQFMIAPDPIDCTPFRHTLRSAIPVSPPLCFFSWSTLLFAQQLGSREKRVPHVRFSLGHQPITERLIP